MTEIGITEFQITDRMLASYVTNKYVLSKQLCGSIQTCITLKHIVIPRRKLGHTILLTYKLNVSVFRSAVGYYVVYLNIVIVMFICWFHSRALHPTTQNIQITKATTEVVS